MTTQEKHTEINSAFDEFMRAFEAFKNANDERISEIEKKIPAPDDRTSLLSEIARLREALGRINIYASDASTLPTYELGKSLINIADTARAAITSTGDE